MRIKLPLELEIHFLYDRKEFKYLKLKNFEKNRFNAQIFPKNLKQLENEVTF